MALSAEETATYTTRLAEAENAMHAFRMGQNARTYVDQNGERVEFSVTNVSSLRAYILELKVALGKPTGIPGPLTHWAL